MSTYGLKKKKTNTKDCSNYSKHLESGIHFIRVKECKYHISYSDMKS